MYAELIHMDSTAKFDMTEYFRAELSPFFKGIRSTIV